MIGTVQLVRAAATPSAGGSSLWWAAIVALLGSSVVGGLITAAAAQLRVSATVRREGYAQAVKTLIARHEYPYRVRRRVSDAAEVLQELAQRGNDLQEQLAACRTWVSAESRAVGHVYDEALRMIDQTVNPATTDAWNQPPITAAAEMNLGGWNGPGDPWPHLLRLQKAIAFRFGWRRLVPARLWRGRLT